MFRQKIYIFLITCLLVSSGVFAEEPRMEASIENDRVSVGNPQYLYVSFYGSQDVPQPDMPEVDGLQIRYVGPSTKISVVNGKVSSSITHTYLVIPSREGEYDIGPFFTNFQGKMYKAGPIRLVVSSTPTSAVSRSVSTPPPAPMPGSGSAAPDSELYTGDKVFLVMDIDKRVLYMNEIVPLTVTLYVNGVGLKDIEYPMYPHEGFSVGEFEEPQKRQETYRGRSYNTLVFQQTLFGIKEGDYILGPAGMSCKMVVRDQTPRRRSLFGRSIFDDDFFGDRFGYQTYPIELESNEIPVTILPFPEEGRPDDFRGAVGYFDMDVEVDPRKVKIGDPVVVKMTISGRGNLDTVTAPRITAGEGFKTYEPQVTVKPGKKIYEQILIPKSRDADEIPGISFSYFNPSNEKYVTIKKGPFSLDVVEQPESERTVKLVSTPGDRELFYPEEQLGRDILYIKEDIGELRRRSGHIYLYPSFWGVLVLPAVLLGFFYGVYRKRERMLKDKSYARFMKAPRKARKGLAAAKKHLGKDDSAFYDTIFKTLQEYLAGRFDIPIGNVTVSAIEDRIGREYDRDIAAALRDVFSKCEIARYASSVKGGHEAEKVLYNVRKIIDYMEKVRV